MIVPIPLSQASTTRAVTIRSDVQIIALQNVTVLAMGLSAIDGRRRVSTSIIVNKRIGHKMVRINA
jgi:hypothetical protein